MQNYIDRGGELVYQPPFAAAGVEYYGFILDADKGKLEELCDRYLNAPLGGGRRFVPAGGFVLLACCNLSSLRSTTPPYNNFGNFVEHEVAFWVMVIDKSRERLYWFIPYIFIDNTYAMAMGRELYGFPKSIGTISLPTSPAQAEQFSLDTLVVKKYPPLAKGEIKRLVEVRKAVAGAYSGPVGSWPDLGGLVRKVVGFLDDELNLFADIRLVIHSMDDLLHLRIPLLFLKQIRDVVDPAKAAYQAIVETTSVASQVHQTSLLASNYDIAIEACDSHPLRRDFGMPAAGTLRSKISFYVNFDFEIGLGSIVPPNS
jgi:Acetoacetate decarboxylase (ADC)